MKLGKTKYLQSFLLLSLMLAGDLAWAKPPYKVYGYLQGSDAVTLSSLPWGSLTHVMDAFALPNSGPGSIDMTNARGTSLVSAAHANNTRCNLSLGGATASLANFVNDSNGTNVNTFVNTLVNQLSATGYDGIDIDWEFPTAAQKTQFMTFMQKLYTAVKAMSPAYDGSPRDVTFFISAGGNICGVDWSTIGNYCDAGIMSGYDYYVDAYNGPLQDPGVTYVDCASQSATADIVGTFGKLRAQGMPAAKLALGCPLYGTPNEVAVITLLKSGTGFVYHTPQSEFSCTYAGSAEYGDNAQSFCDKINWAMANGLQGIGLWEIAYAYPPTDPAVTSIWSTIGGSAACLNIGTPTATSTASPGFTHTASPTITPTPNCQPGGLLDDFERGTVQNYWSGWWSVYGGAGVSYVSPNPFALAAPGYSSAHDARITGTCDVNNPPSVSTGLTATGAAVDVSAFSGIQFWFKGDGKTYRVQVHCTLEGSNYNDYKYDFTAPAGVWTQISVAYNGFQFPGWGPAYSLDWTKITSVAWLPITAGSYDLAIDNINFVCMPQFTPTPSSTMSPSSTPTASPTRSPSPSASNTPSASATATPSLSASFTAALTNTFSATPSASTTSTMTPSATPSASSSTTATKSPSASLTASPTPTRSSTGSATPSVTLSSTPSRSSTPSNTLSGTPSATPSVTVTDTNVPPGSTSTATPTVSPTFSASPTASPTPSATPSSSTTPTMSPSATLTASSTQSATPTASPSCTRSFTASATPTASPSGTLSASPSTTPAISPSPSLTSSSTPTLVVSPTFTPPPTSSFTPTPWFSFSASPTASPVPATPSASQTALVTASASPWPLSTFTPSLTASPALPNSTATSSYTGTGQVLKIVAYPNPQTGPVYGFTVLLNGPAQGLDLKIYSKNMVLIAPNHLVGPFLGGWNPIYLNLPGLAEGAYYIHAQSEAQSSPCVGKWMVLR